MFDDLPLWVMFLLSLPFAVYAVTPLVRPLYRLVGRKFVFSVQQIQTRPLFLGSMDQLGIYEINLYLCNGAGMNIKYSYRSIRRGVPAVAVSLGGELDLFAIPWLTTRVGWSSQTAYAANGALRDSIGVYVPFWFIGILPLVSISYALFSDRNLIFDIFRLLGSGG